jgi:hypothetical protein
MSGPKRDDVIRRCVATLAVVLAGAAGTAAREDSKSAPLAKELTTLMTTRQLDVFAVEDPTRPGYFVAVRAYPGVQLLLVGAESNSIQYMEYQLERKDYGEAYSALNSTAVPATKLFVQDMGCDGVRREGDRIDVIYQQAASQFLLDGSGKANGLSKDAYSVKAAQLDAQYAELLQLVLDSIRSAAAGGMP